MRYAACIAVRIKIITWTKQWTPFSIFCPTFTVLSSLFIFQRLKSEEVLPSRECIINETRLGVQQHTKVYVHTYTLIFCPEEEANHLALSRVRHIHQPPSRIIIHQPPSRIIILVIISSRPFPFKYLLLLLLPSPPLFGGQYTVTQPILDNAISNRRNHTTSEKGPESLNDCLTVQ